MNEKARLVVSIILVGLIVWPIAAISLVNAQAGEVTIPPTDDTYVASGNPASNYGGASSLYVSKYQPYEISYEERTWLKFNLSSVPDGAVVDSATLRLYCGWATETYNVYAHSSEDTAWTELSLIWFDMPSYNATSLDVEQVATTGKWYNWSVTYAVQKAVNGIHGGPDVVTIVLLETAFKGAVSSVAFHSKESYAYPPELTVHWSGIVPELPSFLVLPLFMMATLAAVIAYKRKHAPTPEIPACS